MSQPTFAIAVTFHIKTDCIDSFRTRVVQQARDSVELEPGCCQFDVHVDESDPAVIFLYEAYVDAAAFDVHRTTPHFLDFNQQVTPWVESKSLMSLNLVGN